MTTKVCRLLQIDGMWRSTCLALDALPAENLPLLVRFRLNEFASSVHKTKSIGLCDSCIASPQSSTTVLGAKTGKIEQRMLTAHEICATCAGLAPGEPVDCESLDCAWLYTRKKAEQKLEEIESMDILVDELDSGRLRLSPQFSPEEDLNSVSGDVS